MSRAYYNENNKYAVAWLRNLIDAKLLPTGDVDDRDIREVQPSDLAGYVQCHFFSGIGGWPFAARCARWPDDRQLWTGSCPCQPFSIAGRRRGTADARHLWPDFHRLICAWRPAVIMGEQVAGKAGETWIDRVCADLEAEAFAVRSVDVTAYAVGAPHERQRIYWTAKRLEHAAGIGRREGRPKRSGRQREPASAEPAISRGLEHADSDGQLQSERRIGEQRRWSGDANACWMGDPVREGWPVSTWLPGSMGRTDGRCTRHSVERPDDAGFWHDAEDIWCEWDQKCRRAKPGLPMLVDGLSGRVHAFTAFGNAVVAPLAEECIRAYLEVEMS